MNTPDNSDPATTRAQAFQAFAAGVDAGLPAPQCIRFYSDSVSVDFDSRADLDGWIEHFGFTADDVRFGVRGQPYPDLADPASSTQWISSAWRMWNGWQLHMTAGDPITDEQRQHWIDSGQAAAHAGHDCEAQ